MITCTQEVRDLFMASHRQVMRITLDGGAIRESERVYAVLSDSTEVPLGALVTDGGTEVGADATWALFRGYIQDVGEGLEITEDDILVGGFVLDRYSMCTERIEIGSAVAAELTLNLRNLDGTFDSVKFEGAEMHVELGVKDWDTDDPVQWISLGYFTADKQPKNASAVKVTALDRMLWFDVDVDWESLTFPCTVASLVTQVCTICSVPFATTLTTLPNYDYTISYAPGGTMSYRTLIQWCALLTGTCAQINGNGELVLKWYTDCGVTITSANRYSHTIEEEDITLTGIYYRSETGMEYLEGTAGYALETSGCLILQNNVETALQAINTARSGFHYRPFTAVIQSAPFLEPLDMITFTDKDGNDHPCIVSKITYTGNASTPVSGVGETARQVSYANLSGLTKEQEQAVDDAKKYATNYMASDETGIMVANMTDGQRYTPSTVESGTKNAFIDPNGFYVRDGSDVLAQFGTTSQIGKDDANHQVIDSNGINGVNVDGVSVFNVGMNSGVISTPITVAESWMGSIWTVDDEIVHPTSLVTFPLDAYNITLNSPMHFRFDDYFIQQPSDRNKVNVTVIYGDETQQTVSTPRVIYVVNYDIQSNALIVRASLVDPSMEITYDNSLELSIGTRLDVPTFMINTPAPAYSLGTRMDERMSEIGAFSGICGEFLSAKTRDQFACGRFNRDESDYAFMVGNGSMEDGDSNALAVTWDGNMMMALDEDATTGTDADLYSAITSFGWEDDVIVW